MSDLRFDGRVAVITGAGRGLGRAYALLLAAQGAKVVVNDIGGSLSGAGRDAGPAEAVVAEIKAAGGEAVACLDSVATAEGGQAIIDTAIKHFGQIDILIHNAGTVRRGTLKDMSHEDFNAVVDVHLRGAFYVVRPAFPLMCERKYGRIVLTSSIGGVYGNNRIANYAVSKAGMIGLSNVAAIEGEPDGVKCNVILPGAHTRMDEGAENLPEASQFPPMTTDMVAPIVAWLSHEDCSITGENLFAIAGRVATAYIAESQGVYRPDWTIAQVGEQIQAIRDKADPLAFPIVPHGHWDHIVHSFDMARKGGA